MKKLIFTLLFSTYSVANIAQAETAWVTDQLKITLRSGESTRHKIIKELYAGTELNVLSANPETGFTLVKTDSGLEGYVMSRFVTDEIPATARARQLETTLANFKQGNEAEISATLSQTVDELNQEILRLNRDNDSLQNRLDEIMAISGDAVKLSDQHLEVLERNKILENELSIAKAENQRLEASNTKEGYFSALASVLLGIAIALVVPRLSGRRTSAEWH